MVSQIVCKGSDDTIDIRCLYANNIYDENSVKIATRGGIIPFASNGVTNMELYINGSMVNSSTEHIKYKDGIITLKVGTMDNIYINRVYGIAVMSYDPKHPNGQLLIHPDKETANIEAKIVDKQV